MTINEANEILSRLNDKSTLTPEEEFELIETLEFMVKETGDCVFAEWLGGFYYDKKMFDLAQKYYELAETQGSRYAWIGLGYIWYYGRTGKVDYEKAFNYFTKMVEYEGDEIDDINKIEARFKLADMYKNGYYVEKDYEKYKEIIEQLYDEIVNDERYLLDDGVMTMLPEAEVCTRLAAIRTEEGKTDEAIDLYYRAKNDLVWRVATNRFFGDLNRINWLVNDLYKLIDFDPADFDLYDLYYLLKNEHLVSFKCKDVKHEIESKLENNEMAIRFDDIWYRNIDDFFLKAVLDGESIEHVYHDLEDWMIEK